MKSDVDVTLMQKIKNFVQDWKFVALKHNNLICTASQKFELLEFVLLQFNHWVTEMF